MIELQISLPEIKTVKLIEIRDHRLMEDEVIKLISILENESLEPSPEKILLAEFRKKQVHIFIVYYSNHIFNKSVFISPIRLKMRINDDDSTQCAVPTCLQCLDFYAFLASFVLAVLAICNYASPYQHSDLVLMLFQLASALLLALTPIRNLLCNFAQSELIFEPQNLLLLFRFYTQN